MGDAYLHTEGNDLIPSDLYIYDGTSLTIVDSTGTQGGGSSNPGAWPPAPGAWLGVYQGDYTVQTDDGKSWLLRYPDIASTYFAYANRLTTSNQAAMSALTARILRGTRPVITQWPAKAAAGGSNATAPPLLMSSAMAGDATAVAWFDAYLAALDTLSKVDQSIAVLATVMHEWTVAKSSGYLTGTDADAATYGQFLTWFLNRARTKAPLVKIGPWYNASHGSADEKAILANMSTNPGDRTPDWISIDLYTTSGANHAETETLDHVWRGPSNVGWITGTTDYVRLGSPPLIATEFGVSRFFNGGSSSRTDAEIAAYYTNIRQTMDANNIAGAVMFNRDSGPLGKYKVDDGAHPLATAAFAASLAASPP